jgi:hypothetical protein
MISYEFNGVDVVKDMQKMIQESLNKSRPNLTENIVKDKEAITSFLPMMEDHSIDESHLTVGKKYFPMLFSVTYPNKSIGVLLTIEHVQFLGVSGSRLKFVCAKGESIFYPSDAALTANWFRYVYQAKDQLDQAIRNILMKFKNTDWVVSASGYNIDGKMHPISNI